MTTARFILCIMIAVACLMPLLYGSVSRKLWFKAGAPNGERNLQNYNPLIRAEEKMRAMKVRTEVAGWKGLPNEVSVPAIKG